jgi:hypothetical protein
MNIRLPAGQTGRSEGFLSRDLLADISLASLYAKSPKHSPMLITPQKSASVNHLLAPIHVGRGVGWRFRIARRENRRPPCGIQIIRDGPTDNSARIDFKQDERFLATTPYHY